MAQKRNNRSRRPRREMDVKDQEVKMVDKSTGKVTPHNDPDWYIYDRDMFDGVISMPTLEFKGVPIVWKNVQNSISPNYSVNMNGINKMKDSQFRNPTVIGYGMNPGLSAEYASRIVTPSSYTAINVAARKMYAELSASNAKTSMYAPQDISMLILSIGQVIAMASHLKRIYGIAKHFNFYSRGIPEQIFSSMRFRGYRALMANLSDFRSEVNQEIAKLDTIQFPAGLSYFKKCKYIYENIFVDRDEKMITYQLMYPRSTWTLDEETDPDGSMMVTTDLQDKSYRELLDIFATMIENILTSSTFNYIFADIINLANRNVLNVESLKIDPLPIDFLVSPVYSEQFNWQVMNMTILPFPNANDSSIVWSPGTMTRANDVKCSVDTNRIIYTPTYILTADSEAAQLRELAKYLKSVPVRLPDTNPSQELFVELLAYYSIYGIDWKYVVAPATGFDRHVLQYTSLTDYYCTNANIITASESKMDGNLYIIQGNYIPKELWVQTCMLQQQVHFPFVGCIDDSTVDTGYGVNPNTRLSAYTQVDHEAIKNLRYQTFLGLFSFKKN